jgi:hypothetical protein
MSSPDDEVYLPPDSCHMSLIPIMPVATLYSRRERSTTAGAVGHVGMINALSGKRKEVLERLDLAPTRLCSAPTLRRDEGSGGHHARHTPTCGRAYMNPYLAHLRPHGKMILIDIPEKHM